MNTDLKFLFRYWKRNKRSFITIIMSVALLVTMLLVTLLFERTDIRRELHDYYNTDGAFDIEYRNVDKDTISLIKNNSTVDKIGEIYCVGKVKYGDFSATVGAFKDRVAEELAHYPVMSGKLPECSSEISLTESLKNTFCPSAKIGETITLEIFDINGENSKEIKYTLVGILNDVQRTTFEDPVYGYDNCDPRVLISYEDAESFSDGYINVIFSFINGEQLAVSGYEDSKFAKEDALRHECFERGYSLNGIGRSHGIQMVSGASSEDEIAVSSKSQMIRIISVFAVIISVISMLSCIDIVMKKRMESIHLMRCIGYSKARIFRVLVIEAFILFIIGIITGLALGIIIYESAFAVQTDTFGLSKYRGYTAEWIVSQKAYSPFFSSVIIAGITILISYTVIIIRMNRDISIVVSSSKKRYFFKIHSVSSAVRRVLAQGAEGVLQATALVCVLFASTLGYLYCIKDGKGTSVVAQTTMNKYMQQDNIYEVSDGIDLNKLNCDCYMQVQGGLVQAVYLSPFQSRGLEHEKISELYRNGAETVYSWSDPFMLMTGVEDSSNPTLLSNLLDEQNCERLGFLNGSVSAIPCFLMNDTMLSKLSDICECDFNNENAVWVSIFGDGMEFSENEAFTVYSARSDESGYMSEEIINTQMIVSDCIKADSALLENDRFLCGVLGEYRYYPGFLVLDAEYAQRIGIFNNTYDKILLSANGDEDRLNSLLSAVIDSGTQLNITTRFNLSKEYTYNTLNEYSTVAFLFVFLFLIYIVGYCNVLKLRLKLKSSTLTMMRCFGVTKNRLTGYLISDSLKIPAISTILSAGLICSFRKLLVIKYQEYCELINRRDSISYGKENELKEIKLKLRELRNDYMLLDEMWIPDWIVPFLILVITICIVSVLTVVALQRKSITNNLTEAVSSKDQE